MEFDSPIASIRLFQRCRFRICLHVKATLESGQFEGNIRHLRVVALGIYIALMIAAVSDCTYHRGRYLHFLTGMYNELLEV